MKKILEIFKRNSKMMPTDKYDLLNNAAVASQSVDVLRNSWMH